jgi:capsular exopolysaccharide synthesis family protein
MSHFEAAAPHHAAPGLKEYLQVLRVRKGTVLGVLALVVGSALAYSLTRTPIYEAEARVQAPPTVLTTTDPAGTELNMETEVQIATSNNVATIAAEELGADQTDIELLKDLEVAVEGTTEILIFTYSDPNPRFAQRAAQAFAEAYLENRAETANQDLETLSQPLEQEIEAIEKEIEDVERRLAQATDDAERAALETEQTGLVADRAVITDNLEELTAPGSLSVGDVIRDAERPQEPASPDHTLNFAMALLVGMGLGVGAAFVQERLDDRLRGRADLESHAGVPVLAVVGSVRSWRRRDEIKLVTLTETESSVAEAYRTLRTGVLFDAASNTTKTILVTSAEAGEGKTTTTANLGVSLAQAGKKVALVSADLRRPRLQDFFGKDQGPGLTNVLAGELTLSEALSRLPQIQNVTLLPSGPVPGNPAELLSSQSMRSLMLELRSEADFILIDAPPLLAVADSLMLAQLVDGVILVADAERTHRSAVQQTRQLLTRVDARVIGAVLNNFEVSRTRAYQPYGGYDAFSGNGARVEPAARTGWRRVNR